MFQEHTGFDLATALPDRRRAERTPFRQERRPEERIQLLGQAVDLMRPEEVLHHIARWVEEGRKSVVANHNLHSLYLVRREAEMARFYALADIVQLDSTPLAHFTRTLRLHSRPFHRSTYLDWRDHFWSLADRRGWRVMYVGGAEGVADEACRRLRGRYPRAVIGAQSGYFDARDGAPGNTRVIETIRAFKPDILFVGMGMPRQETWIARNHAALPDAVIFSVGAAFDYEAGAQRAAPRWMGRSGLEWLYRLVADPKRLFVRYCIEPWFLIGPAIGDVRLAMKRRA